MSPSQFYIKISEELNCSYKNESNFVSTMSDYLYVVDSEMDSATGSAFGECGVECSPEVMRLCACAGRALGTGAAVMAGAGGAGRRASVAIVAAMLGAKVVTIATKQQFMAQIKNVSKFIMLPVCCYF